VRPLPPTVRPAPARLVAIGDLHGDITALRGALHLAGAIDPQDHWSGGPLVVVQTGDQLDRGDSERAILDWIRQLTDEAARAGGAFIALNGNHEVMNVQGDFRYVTPGGYDDFRAFEDLVRDRPRLALLPEVARPRAAAFAPGGPYARRLAEQNTIVVVGDTVFVHGGLLPAHVDYGFEAINRGVRAWMLGDAPRLPEVMDGEDSPVWLRLFAITDDAQACAVLQQALDRAHARRLVVGHTVQQQGINAACDGHVWRIDVGLARYYGGPMQALEIAGERVSVLRASAGP
jgi:hypothetical protein